MMVSTQTKIQVMVEIPTGTYNQSATFESINAQVAREGVQIVNNAIREKGGRVIGTPKLIAVTVMEESR